MFYNSESIWVIFQIPLRAGSSICESAWHSGCIRYLIRHLSEDIKKQINGWRIHCTRGAGVKHLSPGLSRFVAENVLMFSSCSFQRIRVKLSLRFKG